MPRNKSWRTFRCSYPNTLRIHLRLVPVLNLSCAMRANQMRGLYNRVEIPRAIIIAGGVIPLNIGFIASELNWKEKGLTVRQETKFPQEEGTTLIFHASQPAKLTVNLRVPYWATRGMIVKVNGQEWTIVEQKDILAIVK